MHFYCVAGFCTAFGIELSSGIQSNDGKLKTVIKSVDQGGIADTLGLVKKGEPAFNKFYYLYSILSMGHTLESCHLSWYLHTRNQELY